MPRIFDFNSRPREGANPSAVAAELYPNEFQFPPPRGGERGPCSPWASGEDFNSRPREGANISAFYGVDLDDISIPAPARGRTFLGGKCQRVFKISIPAPARGRTKCSDETMKFSHFNSRPREGANQRR